MKDELTEFEKSLLGTWSEEELLAMRADKERFQSSLSELSRAAIGIHDNDYSTFGFVNAMDEHGRSKRGLAL